MTNTDKTVSTERLREMLAAIPRYADGTVRSAAWVGRVPAPELEAMITELLASRTQEPAEPFAYTTTNIVEGFSDPRTIVGSIWPKRTAGEYATIPLYLTPPALERSKEEVGVRALDIAKRWAAWIDDASAGEEDEGGHLRATFEADKATLLSALEPASLHKGEVEEQADYLVWSNEHRAWWRANSQGYARSILEAGRYTRAEAVDIADKSRNGWELDRRPDEIAVAIADLPPPIRAALSTPGEEG